MPSWHEAAQYFLECFKLLAALAIFAVAFGGILVALAKGNERMDRNRKTAMRNRQTAVTKIAKDGAGTMRE